jgi:hypothetical protein
MGKERMNRTSIYGSSSIRQRWDRRATVSGHTKSPEVGLFANFQDGVLRKVRIFTKLNI